MTITITTILILSYSSTSITTTTTTTTNNNNNNNILFIIIPNIIHPFIQNISPFMPIGLRIPGKILNNQLLLTKFERRLQMP